MYVCQRILLRRDTQAQNCNMSPSHSVSNTHFPMSALSFPWLHVAAVSLLSKKGLRYLLYPFISLWMVGGRISPSFTSALSKVLSNNLKTKRGREREQRENRNKNYFSRLLVTCVCQVDPSSRPLHYSYSLQGVNWAPRQTLQTILSGRKERRLKWQLGVGEGEEK